MGAVSTRPAPWAAGYLTRGLVYRDKGRTPPRLDCWGLVRLVHQEVFDQELPSFLEEYASALDPDEALRAFEHGAPLFQRVERSEAQPGDVVLLQLGGTPLHAGVYVGGDLVLQLTRAGASLESVAPHRARGRRVEGVYRWLG